MTPEQIKAHHAELTRAVHASPMYATDFVSGQTRLNSNRIPLQQKADAFYNANIDTFQPKTTHTQDQTSEAYKDIRNLRLTIDAHQRDIFTNGEFRSALAAADDALKTLARFF